MSRLVYAAIADDDTGASDLAGMFADQGVRVALLLGLPSPDELHAWTEGAECVVIAAGTRALPPAEAYSQTASAIAALQQLTPRTMQIKYCSTFDSTSEGNIGPSLDAAMDTLAEPFTIALPALPVNGRTTYCGYHFVKGELLSDSPMRNHPLTPMTNPNLVSLLSSQTHRSVGLTPYSVVSQGPEAIRSHWRDMREAISIVDCLDDRHAADVAEAACDLKLISGGSAFGVHLPPAWRRRGWIPPASAAELAGIRVEDGCGALVVAGSCSVATARQNEAFAAAGACVFELDPIALLERGDSGIRERVTAALRRGENVLLKTQSSTVQIDAARAWGQTHGLDRSALGLQIARALAAVVRDIVHAHTPAVLIVAGGETSTAVCRALPVRAMAVGRSIQPGVPLCVPVEGIQLPVVLKSGNFGSDDFYQVAIGAASRLREGVS